MDNAALLTVLFLLGVCVAGCAPAASAPSPLYWHEGERLAWAPEGMGDPVGAKAPASGGRALAGGPLAAAPGGVRYALVLPLDIPDATLLLRCARFHYVPMDPSRVRLHLAGGGRTIERDLTFGDTGGWGDAKGQWGLLAVDVGPLAAGTWQLELASAMERRGDVALDGFFLAPPSVRISAAELAVDRVDIDATRYVGVDLGATTINQGTFEGLRLVARAFVPRSLDVTVTLLDAAGRTPPAVLYGARNVPLTDVRTVLGVSGAPLRELDDGQYILRTQWQSAPAMDVPLLLVGRLAATVEARIAAIERFGAQLASMELPRKDALLADYEHAAGFLRTAWGQIQSGTADVPTVAGVRRTLEQYELTRQRILEGHDPWAGRTGDLRLAFRSRATGRLEPYRLVLPDTYRTDGSTPVFMALNGTEDRFLDRGDDAAKRVANARGYAILSPRASSGYWREGQQDLVQVVEHVLETFEGLDRRRVYCTGASAGGFGTYGLATARPDLFAAIACASGVGNYRRLAQPDRELTERFTAVPTLILHGEADPIVPPTVARDVAARLDRLGYPHEVHIFPGHGHGYVEYAEQYLNLTLDYFDRHAPGAQDGPPDAAADTPVRP